MTKGMQENRLNQEYTQKEQTQKMEQKMTQRELAQKIRSQYEAKPYTKLEALKELDCKVKKPAVVFAYTFGSAAALVLGAGMSLIMTDLSSKLGLSGGMVPGVGIGVLGMGMALVNYPVYRKWLQRRKKRYAKQILALSEQIMNC